MPATVSNIIKDTTPVVTSGKELLELARTAATSNATDKDPNVAVQASSPYKAMWPSWDSISQYAQKTKKWWYRLFSFIFKPSFQGPHISVWDATMQKTVYGSAWGIKGTSASMTLEPVGGMIMKEGMPYFISPDNDGNITWVGSVPQHATVELKVFYNAIGSLSENFIVLPLDTTIETAKDLCEAKADDNLSLMSDSNNIEVWDANNQTRYYPTGALGCLGCGDIKDTLE